MQQDSVGSLRDKRVWLPVLALVVLGFALYLPRLGASALWDPWEPKYAQTAREMADAGDWIVPQYRDVPRLNKPPLSYWLIGASHAVFGDREAAARLPSALLAVLAAASLGFAFAARGRPIEGTIAGAALLTGPQWLLLGRTATPAMPLAAFLGIALAVVVWRPLARTPLARRSLFAVLGLLVAAAGMTDWPRGLLLPAWAVCGWAAFRWSWKGPLGLAAVAVVYYFAQTEYSVALNLTAAGLALVLAAVILRLRAGIAIPVLLAGAILVLALIAPWFVAARDEAPEKWSLYRYKYAFNLGETERRHKGPVEFVTRTVAVGGMPWAAAAVVGLIAAVRRRKDDVPAILAGAWLGGTLFFTLSEAKMGHFYAVIQPAVAGLAAVGLVALLRKLDWSALAGAVAVVGVGLTAWERPSRLLGSATVKTNLKDIDLSVAVVAVVVAWGLAVVAARLARRESWLYASIVPPALLSIALGTSVVPRLEPYKSVKPMWERYLEDRAEGEPCGLVGPSKDSAFYYSNNTIHRLDDFEEIVEFLSGDGAKFLIGTRRALDQPVKEVPGKWVWLDKRHGSHWLVRYDPREVPPPAD